MAGVRAGYGSCVTRWTHPPGGKGSVVTSADASDSGRALLITGIGDLVTNDVGGGATRPGELGRRGDDEPMAVVVEDGLVAWIGPAAEAPSVDRRLDVQGRAVLPGWVDSHTHAVHAGDRAAEFAVRLGGRADRLGAGGNGDGPADQIGIGATVAATRGAGDGELTALARARRWEMLRGGTTCAETKTGYGLTIRDEARSATVATAAGFEEVTFLGAHVVPVEFTDDPDGYLDLVCGPMLDLVAPTVGWVDVCCDEDGFDEAQTRRVLAAGQRVGLGLRVHGQQHALGAAVRIAVEAGAAAVDHCTFLAERDVADLASSAFRPDGAGGTVATLLPLSNLATRHPPPPGRALSDAGAVVALASDGNAGSVGSFAMNLVVALGVSWCGLTPEEAVWAATAGGARALRRTDVGRLAVGARADLHVLDAPGIEHLVFRPGAPLTWAVVQDGVVAVGPPDGTG